MGISIRHSFWTAATLLALSHSAFSANDAAFFDEEIPRGTKVPINIASLDVKFGVKIADLNFFEGLSLSARYRYQVEPSYQGGYYTRIDAYTLKFGISPGDFFDEKDLPVYLKIERGSDVIFVRQFQSQVKALAAIPVFDPRRIPFSSKLAIEHMEPGDFVAIPAEMNVALGANANYPIVPGIDANLGINAGIISGKFQIHVFRMPNNHVRLRLITDHGHHISASAGIKSGYDFVGVKIADSVISKFIKADLPKLTYTYAWGGLVLLDYVYDLNKEEVRNAYDRVLKSTFRFRIKDIALMDSLRKKLVTDLLETERIRKEDMNLPVSSQRIHRLFSGDNAHKRHSAKISLGSSFLNFDAGILRAENRVTYYDKQDQVKKYNYMIAVSGADAGVAWGLFRWQKNSNLSALVLEPQDEGESQRPSTLENVNLSFEVKDKYISQKQGNKLISQLDRITDGKIFSEAIFDPWRGAERIRDGRFLVDMWITKQGLRQLEGQSADEIEKGFRRYIDGIETEPIMVAASKGGAPAEAQAFSKFYRFQIGAAARKLEKALDPKLSATERGKAFISLKGNVPFEKLGTGFMVNQMNPNTLDRSVLVRVRADASGVDAIRAIYGRAENLELLNSLQYMQYVIGSGYFDPRWDPIPDLNARSQ